MYAALIDSGALVHGNRDNELILARSPREPWLGAQLLGSIPDHISKSAEMLDVMNFETVDFNMGCPMQKVIKRPAGAALLYPKNHDLAFQCVRIIREKIHKPFTVKMRVLDFEDPKPTVDFCLRLQDMGVEGITIHGRLLQSIYSGPVATHVIGAVREALSIPVTANGGVFSIEDAKQLASETGCSRIMVARGSLGNPWLFRELMQGKPCPPTHAELCDTMEQHIYGMVEMYGEKSAFVLGRKIIVAYLRGRGYSKNFRIRSTSVSCIDDFKGFMDDLRREGPLSATNALDKTSFDAIV